MEVITFSPVTAISFMQVLGNACFGFLSRCLLSCVTFFSGRESRESKRQEPDLK